MSNIDQDIAETFLGWKWISYIGRPTKRTKGYPANMRVRVFLSRELREDAHWKAFLEVRYPGECDGTEPLAYCYCSSGGCPQPPECDNDPDVMDAVESWLEGAGLLWQYYSAVERRGKYRPGREQYHIRYVVALTLAHQHATSENEEPSSNP